MIEDADKQYPSMLITRVSNGYIIKHNDGDTEALPTVEVVNEESEMDIADLLTMVAVFCGYNYNKYGHENLNISWDKKGHKVEE